jgi:hypothetical protein
MNWISVTQAMPEEGKADRVLVYTPRELCREPSHQYRLVDAQFVRILTDATHWAYLEPPK